MSFTVNEVRLEASSILDDDIPEYEAIRLVNSFISLMGGRAWREATQYYTSSLENRWYSLPTDFIRTIAVRDTIGMPTGLAIANEGTAGSTSYGYRVVAVNENGETLACAEVTTSTGNATLDETNYNALTWDEVTGATSYDVYRTTSGGSPSTTGLIDSPTDAELNDTGLAGDSATVPAEDMTGDDYTGYVIRDRRIRFGADDDYFMVYTAFPTKMTTATGTTGTPDIQDVFFYPMAKYMAGRYMAATVGQDDPSALRMIADAMDEMNTVLSEIEIDSEPFQVEEVW